MLNARISRVFRPRRSSQRYRSGLNGPAEPIYFSVSFWVLAERRLTVMSARMLMGRPVRESRSEYAYVALPNDANPLGNVLGGRVMHLIDLCAGVAAVRHTRRPVVTAAIDEMRFLHSAKIGHLLVLKSSVNRVFRTSMEVGVKVWVENPNTGNVLHTSSAYLTFVAIDESGKPIAVPPVFPESEEEQRRYREAGRRREDRLNTMAAKAAVLRP
jgi:acyl-CoA hydrolase